MGNACTCDTIFPSPYESSTVATRIVVQPDPILQEPIRLSTHSELQRTVKLPVDYHDIVPPMSISGAIELEPLPRLLPSLPGTLSIGSHTVHDQAQITCGQVDCMWATVDDRRLYVAYQLTATLCCSFSVAYVVVDYLGCLACPDPHVQEYRRNVLKLAFPWLDCIDQPAIQSSLDYRRNVLKLAFSPVNCIDQPATQSNPSLRTCCRYCGLVLSHHLFNREPVPMLEDELGQPFDRKALYCGMRCPIHRCAGCKQPFVKVAHAHLCAACLVECRRRQHDFQTKRMPIPRWATNEMENHYQDDLVQYDLELKWTTRAVVVHGSGGKSGSSSSYVAQVRCVDRKQSTDMIQQFLDKTEYCCSICRQRFRLQFLLPARVSSFDGSASSSTLLAAQETHAVVASALPHLLCGFCLPPLH